MKSFFFIGGLFLLCLSSLPALTADEALQKAIETTEKCWNWRPQSVDLSVHTYYAPFSQTDTDSHQVLTVDWSQKKMRFLNPNENKDKESQKKIMFTVDPRISPKMLKKVKYQNREADLFVFRSDPESKNDIGTFTVKIRENGQIVLTKLQVQPRLPAIELLIVENVYREDLPGFPEVEKQTVEMKSAIPLFATYVVCKARFFNYQEGTDLTTHS